MSQEIKNCVYNTDTPCTGCNKCNTCDLNPEKICNNCGKCIGLESADYREVQIEGMLENENEVEDYIWDKSELEKLHRVDEGFKKERAGDYEFIEDIPELKDKYNKSILDFFKNK